MCVLPRVVSSLATNQSWTSGRERGEEGMHVKGCECSNDTPPTEPVRLVKNIKILILKLIHIEAC